MFLFVFCWLSSVWRNFFPFLAELKVLMEYDEDTEEEAVDTNGDKAPTAKKVD